MTTLAVLIGLVGLLAMVASLFGFIKPSWLKSNTRKQVFLRYLLGGFILFVVSVALTPIPDQIENLTIDETSNKRTPLGTVVKKETDKIIADKIFQQSRGEVDDYLGDPESCNDSEKSIHCEYEKHGIQIYFSKHESRAKQVSFTRLSDEKFTEKSLRSVGLNIKEKPDFKNAHVIRWDYVRGAEINIFPTQSGETISRIVMQSVPWTTSSSQSSGLPLLAALALSLEDLQDALNERDNDDIGAVFHLKMDDLIDKYGEEMPSKVISTYQFSAQDTKEIRKYKKSMFHSNTNEFVIKIAEGLNGNTLADRFWVQAELERMSR